MFLKQPRRGKTHEVQLTPHKRSAVWGQPQDKRSAVWGQARSKRSAEWDPIAEWGLSAVWGINETS